MNHLKEITLRLEKLSKNWESFFKLLQRRQNDKETVAELKKPTKDRLIQIKKREEIKKIVHSEIKKSKLSKSF